MSESPVKHRKGKPLKSGERQVIRNIYLSLKKDNPHTTIKDIANKTASSCGVSKASVFNIISEFKQKGKNETPTKTRNRKKLNEKLSEFEKMAIRRIMHSFYFNNELPTVDKVLKKVNDDNDLPNFSKTTFRRVLKILNFRYVSRKRNTYLMERHDIIEWRRNYLRKIRQFRQENKKIYYLDETWCNAEHTKKKSGWILK